MIIGEVVIRHVAMGCTFDEDEVARVAEMIAKAMDIEAYLSNLSQKEPDW